MLLLALGAPRGAPWGPPKLWGPPQAQMSPLQVRRALQQQQQLLLLLLLLLRSCQKLGLQGRGRALLQQRPQGLQCLLQQGPLGPLLLQQGPLLLQ